MASYVKQFNTIMLFTPLKNMFFLILTGFGICLTDSISFIYIYLCFINV